MVVVGGGRVVCGDGGGDGCEGEGDCVREDEAGQRCVVGDAGG